MPAKDIHDFRYAISRIHAEKENIINLYNFITEKDSELPKGKDDDFKRNVIKCVNKLQEGLLHKKRFGIEINEIVKSAFKVENEIDYDSIEKVNKLSEKIAGKYSITQTQILFSEIDFKKIAQNIDAQLDSWKYSTDSEEYKFLKNLKVYVTEESKPDSWKQFLHEGMVAANE